MIFRSLIAEKPIASWILKRILDMRLQKEELKKLLKLAGTLLAYEASEFLEWRSTTIKISKYKSIRALKPKKMPLIITFNDSRAIAEGVSEVFYKPQITDAENLRESLAFREFFQNVKKVQMILVEKFLLSEERVLNILEKFKDSNFNRPIILSIITDNKVLRKLATKRSNIIIVTFL